MADAGAKALHTAARRYCIDRLESDLARHLIQTRDRAAERDERLHVEYALRDAQASAVNDLADLATQPIDESETALLGIILEGIERRTPDDFRSASEARDYLLHAGQRARVVTREVRAERGQVEVHEREPELGAAWVLRREQTREAYLAAIASLTVEQAAQVGPLPFRQVMSDSKRRRVGKRLAERWGVEPLRHYWYPLWGGQQPPDVLALQSFYFYTEVGVGRLHNILQRHGITRIWELDELRLDPEYEMDPRLCTFTRAPETYWSSRHLDWLIYTSHEDSITFAGTWLVAAIQQAWPNWQQRLYDGYAYERSYT